MKVIRRLGSGGFGYVDLVEDKDGKQFARKTFSPSQKMSDELLANVRKRFVREANIQQGFNHRNIVSVISAELDGDNPSYLMPVAVSTLADDLDADKTLGGKFISAIGDVVAALEELHGLEIYHRDLKPQNILRFKDGDGFFYAVSDFGLISQKDSTLSKLTVTGMMKGSDYFTAPEITADLKKASRQSDVYSLGCILHEMIGAKDRVPCGEIKEDGEYSQILRSCTRSDPSRRFASARSMLDALVSVDVQAPIIQSDQAKKFADQLDSDNPISQAGWRSFVEFVEDNEESQDVRALLLRLSLQRIEEVCAIDLDLANRLAVVFAEWVRRAAFNFESCDGIANRLETFFRHCSITAKVECLMALLYMGTSHNRWYVERMFAELCSPSMDETLAKRLAIEFRASQDICYTISRFEDSIRISRDELHPLLTQTLKEIC